MADMSQVNLERLRATDAMWEETKHPRADNGQFTSGSGGVSATGGGAKFQKPTASMTTGKFKKPNAEASKVIAEGAKNKEKPQAIIRKANAELNKGEAARKTLNRSKGKINAMRSLAEAATPYHAESQQASVDKFKNVEQMLKKVDKVAASYAGKLAKAAEKGGESAAMAAAEKLNAYIDKQDASDFVKGWHRGRLQLALREYNKGGLKQRKDKMEAELKAKAEQPAAKPQNWWDKHVAERKAQEAKHPMAHAVLADIDYWNVSHYNKDVPSEQAMKNTIESLRMQYDDHLKSAEKWYKMALSVPDLGEETKNSYKQKYETAKGKVEALKALYG